MSATNAQERSEPGAKAVRQRLKVITEADPAALPRILQPFQSLNIVPLSVHAERVGAQYLEVAVDVDASELTPGALQLVAARLNQHPAVIAAVICD